MKRKLLKYFFMLGLLWNSGFPAQAQLGKTLLDHLPIKISDKISFLPAPSLSFKPETNWSFGLSFIGTYSPDSEKIANLSTAQFDIIYTLNKQVIVDLDHHIFLNNSEWLWSGSNSFYNYPELYFSQITDGLSELIESRKLEFNNKISKKIRADWYAGIVHRLQILGSVSFPEEGLIAHEQPIGFQGGIAHGFGIGASLDKRINSINPANGGVYFNLNTGIYSSFIGSDFDFMRIEVDYRKYLKIGKAHTLAIQGVGIFNQGDPPFKLTGKLGGGQIMRGYYWGRYRNRQMYAVQAELRLEVYKRIGMVTFASLGNTNDKLSQLWNKRALASYGLGIRFMLDKKSRANLRLDYAFSKNSQGIYIGYGEAF